MRYFHLPFTQAHNAHLVQHRCTVTWHWPIVLDAIYAVYHAKTARRNHSFYIYCSRNSHWTECVPTPRSAFERVIWYFSTQPNIHRKNLLRRIRSEFQPLEWIEFHAADENSIMYLVFRWARICGNWTFFGMFVALPNAWKWPNCVDLKFETKRERVAFSRP